MAKNTVVVRVVSFMACCAVLAVAQPSDKKGTYLPDVIGLHLLARTWGRPATIAPVWLDNDPCTRRPEVAGLKCRQLDAPVVDENGIERWWKIIEIKINSSPQSGKRFNVTGPLVAEAFSGGKLASLEILDVSFNNINGVIPVEISNLVNLTRLALNNNNIGGTVPAELSALKRLDILWLGFNNFTGGLPLTLGTLAPSLHSLKMEHSQFYNQLPEFLTELNQLLHLDLSYNQFSLSLPVGLTQLTNLSALYLHNNYLSGPLPKEYGNFNRLVVLKLAKNQLTGPIPAEIANCKTLQQLVLNDNQFTGTLPDALAMMPNLLVLSLQTNNFTGAVGPAFSKYPMGFRYNEKLCNDLSGKGYQPCPCTDGQIGQQLCDAVSGPGPCVCPEGSLPQDESGLATVWIILITVGGALMLLLLIALLWWGYRTSFGRKKAGGWEYAGKVRSFPDVRTYRSQAYDPDEIDSYGIGAYDSAPGGLHSRNAAAGASGNATGSFLAPGAALSGGGGPGGAAGTPGAGASASSTAAAFARKFGRSLNNQLTMRQFSYDELQLATNNFSADSIVGADGTCKTYSGVLPSGTYIAVKELEGVGGENADAFAAAVEVFSLVRCPQLVEVLGLCCPRNVGNNRLLVYELMPNGSLDLHLHDVDSSPLALDWNTRMSIALEVAKGLAYLHSMSPQMVHQHVVASTVLLDDHFHAKLSDYCLDSLRQHQTGGLSHANSTNVAVAAGTAAPELAWSSQPTPRTDVYAFGVLLLEIISGRRPIDSTRAPTEQSLVRWVKPRLMERAQVEAMVDTKLLGTFSSAALYQVALLASQCIQTDPEARPSMVQAIEVMQNVQSLPLDSSTSRKAT